MARRQLATIFAVALSGACAGSAPSADVDLSTPGADLAGADLVGAPTPDGAQAAIVDEDQDGLDDQRELALAHDYLPFISMSPLDACPRSGLVVRVRPHPGDATLVHIVYDLLFEKDCGLNGHVGDDEVFAVTIDPSVPAPAGILALRAISHQGTPCQRISECGRCGGLAACETKPLAGKDWPAVWPSRNKHGLYVNHLVSCAIGATCLDVCEDASMASVPAMVNAGEPGHALTHDLTASGLITLANGWTEMTLFHFDPWQEQKFGGAGRVNWDLVDPAFLTPACKP